MVSPPMRSMPNKRSSLISTASLSGDDDDAITPCSPPPAAVTTFAPAVQPHHRGDRSPSPAPQYDAAPVPKGAQNHGGARRGSASSDRLEACKDATWHFDPAEGQKMDDEHLWRRMLDIQRAFHCYNSARMTAAIAELDMGLDVGRCVPSRTCLNLMNDSISELSDDSKRQLGEWLRQDGARVRHTASWKPGFWEARSMHS